MSPEHRMTVWQPAWCTRSKIISISSKLSRGLHRTSTTEAGAPFDSISFVVVRLRFVPLTKQISLPAHSRATWSHHEVVCKWGQESILDILDEP